MKKQQAGMTLIELVIVIIVLGIIAAVAAPRFADISGDAGAAARDGNVGAFGSAATIAIAVAAGAPTDTQLVAQLDGFDCTTTTGTCVTTGTQDQDGVAGTDVSVALFKTSACTVAYDTPGDVITGYQVSQNGVAGTCVVMAN